MSRRSVLEGTIQNAIEAALGAEPDLLLLRNNVGKATYYRDDGTPFQTTFGLGTGSPDLVGLLRLNVLVPALGKRASAMSHDARFGIWFCLEVKAPGETATPEQEKVHTIWRSFGARVFVVTSVEEARAALNQVRREAA